MSEPFQYTVQEGDRMSSIAFAKGADPEATWDDPKNAALKSKRESPEILNPRDTLWLKQVAEVHEGKPEAQNDLDALHVLSEMKLRFMVAGKPLANKPYLLTVYQIPPGAKGTPYQVGLVTDPDGLATFHLRPNVTECTFKFLDPVFEVKLLVGHLRPVNESEGVEQRLNNLGYHCLLPASSPSTDQKATQEASRAAALRRFHFDTGAHVTGKDGQEALKTHTHPAAKPKK